MDPEYSISTYRAMSFFCRIPLRALLDSSEDLAITRSILDMIFIQGISRLTIADMADSTPLFVVLSASAYDIILDKNLPEKLIAIFHEL